MGEHISELKGARSLNEKQKESLQEVYDSTYFWKMTPIEIETETEPEIEIEEKRKLLQEVNGDKFSATAKEADGKTYYDLLGRIDSLSAPDFLASYKSLEEGLVPGSEIVLDVDDLYYISSSGFRVIMIMVKAGHPVVIEHANEEMKELFGQMGFDSIVTIE